jgi:hypothetical protein
MLEITSLIIKNIFIKYLITLLFLALQGCSIHMPLKQVPGLRPITQPANDTPQFQLDEQACLNEVDKIWPNARHENAAVIQFRQCLITKGYRLLS